MVYADSARNREAHERRQEAWCVTYSFAISASIRMKVIAPARGAITGLANYLIDH